MKSYSEEKRIRPNILTGAVYLAVILMMIYWIISIRIYGDKGAFFPAGPFFLYGFFYTAFVLAVQKAVYIMVRLRARRSQYQNAQANMLRSMKVFGVGGLIAGALLIALSYSISGFVLGSERGFIQLMMAGTSILFLGIQGVLRGYLQGIGYTKPIMISDLLIAVTSLIPGIVMVIIFFNWT